MKPLREWRIERLMSIDQLAEEAGVSNKTVIQIEHGRQVPRFRTIRQVSKALHVEPQDVTEFAEAMRKLKESPHPE